MKKRIAILCGGLGIIERGVERYVRRLRDSLSDKYDIDIYSYAETDVSIGIKFSKFERWMFFGFNPLKARNKFTHVLNGAYNIITAFILSHMFGRKVFKKIKEKNIKYDLIFDNFGLGSQLQCNRYRKATSTPFIMCGHSGDRVEFIAALTNPDAFVVLKKESKDYSERQLRKITKKKFNIVIIPNGVDYTPFEKKNRKITKKISYERPIILSTSALDESKRLHLLIDAVSIMKKGTLIMTGDGPLKESLTSYGKKKLGKRFVYLGVVPYEKLVELYYQCDIFSLPSDKENFSTSMLEAMAANKPIVTQKDSARERIVGKAGYCIECTDIKKYADALDRAYSTDFGNTPKKQALKYDWKKTVQMYDELFRRLMK